MTPADATPPPGAGAAGAAATEGHATPAGAAGPAARAPSAREEELLELAYRYVLEHGLADMSLRPLAKEIGSSPRVLLFLFGSKDGLIRALLGRARREEVAAIEAFRQDARTADLTQTARQVWQWLADPGHRHLLGLWVEAYARSLVDPGGPWSQFGNQTVQDWLGLLAARQAPGWRDSEAGAAERTAILALLRGAMLDLLATGDTTRISDAVAQSVEALRSGSAPQQRAGMP
jgi:AcrR family transcriptional regulator